MFGIVRLTVLLTVVLGIARLIGLLPCGLAYCPMEGNLAQWCWVLAECVGSAAVAVLFDVMDMPVLNSFTQ